MKFMALVPDSFCHLIGDGFRIGLIGGVLRYDDNPAAGHVAVMPDVADMPGHAADSRIVFQLVHVAVD